MPATVKKSTLNDRKEDLPEKHVAILFEGAWLFTPDPADATRVLAICPYEYASDHVCVYGVWPHAPGVEGPEDPNIPLTGEMPEGNEYQIDLNPSRPSATSFADLFEAAVAKYNNIYLQNASSTHEITVAIPNQTRRISVPMPDMIRVAGKLKGAQISPGAAAAGTYELGIDGKPASIYVTLIFLYLYSDAMPVFSMTSVTGPDQPTPLATPSTELPTHLVIRVHARRLLHKATTTTEQEHLTDTFQQLRELVTVHPAGTHEGTFAHPDLGLLAPKEQVFERGDTGLTCAELGLPYPADVYHPDFGDLAACAGGTSAVNPVPRRK